MPRNRWQVPGTEWVQILRGPRPPSVKWPKAGQQQQRQTGGPSSHPPKVQNVPIATGQRVPAGDASSCHREDVEDQGICGPSMAVLGEEHTEVAGPPSRIREGRTPVANSTCGPSNQSHRSSLAEPKRLVQHDAAIQMRKAESLKEEEVKRLSEAEEALQRFKVQIPVAPSPPPRSVEALQRMVEQLQIERDALVGQVKHQNSTR